MERDNCFSFSSVGRNGSVEDKLGEWLDKGNDAQGIAVQQWLEANTRGLMQDKNAKMLEEKHWPEAIDPLHRYGTNLGFYFKEWEEMNGCKMTFFEWLDHGGGVGKDTQTYRRRMLDEQKVSYLHTEVERECLEVIAKNGRIYYKTSGSEVQTEVDEEWIYVLSPWEKLYVAKKEKGYFHHSTFLAGAPVLAAGFLQVSRGIITGLDWSSGHYKPTEEHFQYLTRFLKNKHVKLSSDMKSSKRKSVKYD